MEKIKLNEFGLGKAVGEGIYAFDKPLSFTSNQLLTLIKKETGIKKVGHAGTLDPLATGVLVVAIGKKYTKQLSQFVAKEKKYEARFCLGEESETDDAEGPLIKREIESIPTIEQVKLALDEFVGNIKQLPPIYSAVKIRGQEAYKRTRRGEKIELKPRDVFVKSIKIVKYSWPFLDLIVETGPGVYIRSIARDLGDKLGVGGYVCKLIRTKVGEFEIESAISIQKKSAN